ncbi:hypothetical protein ACN28S_02260 [Cystobacter fuscus]
MVQNTGVSFITPAEGAYWFINELMLGRSEREVAIFDERLFREWPFLGASADGPDARTVYDDRGFLLVRSDYPMLDCVERHDAEGLIATRTFDLRTDPFVLQHQLDSVPIMPGTFGFEMLGEAASLFRPDRPCCARRTCASRRRSSSSRPRSPGSAPRASPSTSPSPSRCSSARATS